MGSIEIRRLKEDETVRFTELIRVFEAVFEMKNFRLPPIKHLGRLLERDDFFVFIALSSGKVCGGLTAYTLYQYYSESPLVYIYDLAVALKWQRKGIGTALIKTVNKYCEDAGVEEVFVQADLIDDYALDFYRSTGATSEQVVHFYYPLLP
ncbi:GNAT family N-acetyltransferase [Leptospira gomenensis]|uniref:GNAT family N-acetyltransferase n=1 Tax=Leptospira gomenensis TaxID=2484974 RepID=A0A5F1YF93_9LEPT|nr:GNAT family N-acetyltransferase [Leptospira gomenensis]TGK38445.1 GNAT family N-acetyltransferase [Leptospira gomenensis]TGK42560.1 GNAT family N-acetyltransferase [Leptospira gomenensis]TGK42807.1 GNAT family N-acetyltransferase [Leptospira gomenensis]TGK55808.1 GNAT family N-acetyltransferase [Leptospira gomenensis]